MKLIYELLILLIVVLTTAAPLKAQTDSKHLAVQISDEIIFYTVDEYGHFERLDELSNAFATIRNEWNILSPNVFLLSPDHQKLAFVAYRFSEQSQQETDLFIYSFGQASFQQIPISGIGNLYWSPDSDALAIVGQPYPDFKALDSIYIFDIDSSTLSSVPNSPRFAERILWLPDNIHIIYVKSDSECRSEPCIDVGNLFSVNRLTLDESSLTNLRATLPLSNQSPYKQCKPTKLSWSQNNNRIYYSLNCIDIDDNSHDYLYSVSRNADNRLEGAIAEIYSHDEATTIKDIHPNVTKQGVYLTVVSRVEQPIDSEDSKEAYYWRILYVTQPENIQTISEVELSIAISLTDVSISPNEAQIALSGLDATEDATGYVFVGDLITGQTEISNPTSLRVCQVEWLNDLELLYSEYSEGFCGTPEKIWKLNTESNSAQDITDNIEGNIWILPTAATLN